MKSKNIKFLIFLCVLMLFFIMIRMLYLNEQMKNNQYIEDMIVNLQLKNHDIDEYFSNKLVLKNYDNINNVLEELEFGLFSISGKIFDENLMKELIKAFNEKALLIERFNYINAGAITMLRQSEIELESVTEHQKEIRSIMMRIKNSKFATIEDINDMENEIQMLSIKLFEQNNVISSESLAKLNFVLSSIIKMTDIAEQNTRINLKSKFKELNEIYTKHYTQEINKLKIYGLISLVLLFILAALVSWLLVASRKMQIDLELYKTAVNEGFSSIMFTDKQNLISYANKTFERVSEYDKDELIGKNPGILKSNLHSEGFYKKMQDAVKYAKEFSSDELISRSKSGKYIYESVRFVPFVFEQKHLGFIGIKMDKTKETNIVRELELKNEQLKTQSSIDKLTGFGNYFAMGETLEEQKDGVIISIGIKNFDNLRFFYQTKVIDAMLLAFANTLKLCVQTSEINAELYRFQDDEFYLWYNGDRLGEDIGYIQDYFGFSQIQIEVDGKSETLPGLKTIIGVSLPFDTPQTNRLVQTILAKEHAKSLGSELYEYQENDAIELRYHKNQSVTQLIEYAIENNTVIVECQGIFDVAKSEEKATYYEILVRIIDQSGKVRYPGEFLDVALQAQLYTQITKKVIEHAFALVERYPDYTFSVNLSGVDIIDQSVREFLDKKLQICSDASRICFEILESEEIGDYDVIASFIKHIKGYGSKISIDDFGSGYSNYYRILELDIDNIKIDGSIIKKLPTDQNARYLVETIVTFASKQNYKIVAEFVSSPEILEQVRNFNIHYAQGFLLGKPTPADSL
ncbi:MULTISPECIES: EAL domain-containing protein [unclassified Campylobacter]|uniref:EAL domain-containing protein n=1 Tax=unclassified Campylobacter TaxID=2593542 RepID=UPI003D325130